MAKNIFQKKKRIAHFQNAIDNSTTGENENVLTGCFDYVSSIIQNMDSNFNSIHSNCSKKHGKTRVTNNTVQKHYNPASFSSEDFCTNPNTFKRKFSTSRKFPLMEKSQKILKQLKHNRRIPKPRAHLAALPKSPVKVIAINKNNKKLKAVSKLINLDASNARVSENSSLNLHGVSNNDSRSSKCNASNEFEGIMCKEGENTKPVRTHSPSDDLCFEDSKSNTNVKQNRGESANETTDSEYERFVKENEKGLRKKNTKNQIKSVAKTKASREKSKISVWNKTASNFDDSTSDDDVLSHYSRKVSARKKKRTTRKVSTDETDAGNVGIEELDDEPNRTALLQTENMCSVLHKADSLCDVGCTFNVMLHGVSSCINRVAISESTHLNASDVVSNNRKMPSLINDFQESAKIEPNDSSQNLIIDLCESDDDSIKAACCEPPTLLVSIEEKHSVNTLYSNNCKNTLSKDLTLSVPKDEKHISTNTAHHVKHLDSEEPDLEIVEVISRQNKSTCMTDKAFNRHECSKNDAEGSIISKGHFQVFKTKKLGDVCAPKTVHIENQNLGASDSKCIAVYTTNICDKFNQNELLRQNQRALVNSKCKHLEVSSQNIVQDDVSHEVSRQENMSDDDIVILTPFQTPVNDQCKIFHGRSSAIEKIKTETPDIFVDSLKHVKYPVPEIEDTPLTKDGLNLLKVMGCSSNIPPINFSVCEDSQEFKELDLVNGFHLIEKLKKELCTYHEIIRTEASVGASLKLLETRQAERVNHIRSLVQKYVGKNNISGETVDKFIKEKSSNTALFDRKGSYSFERLSDDSPSIFSLTDLSRDTKDCTSKLSQPSFAREILYYPPPPSLFVHPAVASGSSDIDIDFKPNIHKFDVIQNVE